MTALTQIAQTDPGLMLAYSVSTSPSPIRVSPQTGDPEKATITIVASDDPNRDDPAPVYVDQWNITLPVGDGPTSLTSDNQFKAMVSPDDIWQAGDPSSGTVTIKSKSDKPVDVTGKGVTITLHDITVNRTVGTAQISISEAAAEDPDGPFDPKVRHVDLGKFPHEFSAGNFRADRFQVGHGQSTTLHWEGSSENATYTMLWGNYTQNVSSLRSWVTPSLSDTTAFYLRVDVTHQGETVTQLFSLMITVVHPDLTVSSLLVLGETALQGEAYIEGQLTQDQHIILQNGNLDIYRGDIFVRRGNLAVSGGTSLDGPTQILHNAGSIRRVSKDVNWEGGPMPTDGLLVGQLSAGQIVSIKIGDLQYRAATDLNNFTGPYVFPWLKGDRIGLFGTTPLPSTNWDFTFLLFGSRSLGAPLELSDLHSEAEIPEDVMASLKAATRPRTLSGSGRLAAGEATVEFADPGWEPTTAYRTLVVPTAECNGLAVVQKGEQAFLVRELVGGSGDATFDWQLVFDS